MQLGQIEQKWQIHFVYNFMKRDVDEITNIMYNDNVRQRKMGCEKCI